MIQTSRIEEVSQEFQKDLHHIYDHLNKESLENLRQKYVGKKGLVSLLLKEMGGLSPEERPIFGKEVNILRQQTEENFARLQEQLKTMELEAELKGGYVDVTLPGKTIEMGARHPLNQIRDQILDFFVGLGFKISEGREIETDWYNFEALNIPADHPARDMQDTFYVAPKVVLRTHTSGIQVHEMENSKPPIRLIAPGFVYRVDSDASHAPMFQQVEGLVVDEGINFAHLKGTLFLWAKSMFGEQVKVRFRPSFFPFTEPSAEMDISCVFCGGSGCRVCKHSGWIEIGGCGCVDPNVFGFVGIDSEKYTGFAFGMGIDRIAMLKYQINEIGLLTSNDNRFLRQF